ncbi:LysE family translocator [Hyphomicrobium sulfonivorans]|uniref:Lysine exporter protein (LYSE/YGGA) n=1 Tax=Hyphomicrobium sulfonivorans TaxID=121290 RepID=A0A125NTW4_HYPSL|nr:LysE family transporter [Hyphomicrobium sulfonivorans]KWT64709.1 Lysine exporter protein (LYSE/YGGA) [Hyphomicrobium sulfonivorans]MBI1649760.1 LysE family transporter [Hyphomicrobium sulfonivorans]NSL71676.1 lysine transporter LysE [Hyphomicrobium sulfonivorans]
MDFLPNPLIIPVGIVIGILVAAPVGPVNVLCIQRAIERGFWGGLAAGIGAMLGDGLIALFAALGVGAISGAVQYHRMAIQLLGGLVLVLFGLKLYFAKPRFSPITPESEQPETLRDFVWDIPQTFLLTITNPGAVLGLFAIFGGVSTFVEVDSYVDALTIVAAVMAGSLAWWLGLSHLIARFRHRFSVSRLQLINKVAGLLLIGFGVLLFGEVIAKRLGLLL